MKRFLAILLALTMLTGLMPTVFATGDEDVIVYTEEDYVTADLLWEKVNAKEEEMKGKKATVKQTTQAIVAEITASPYYAENTLIRNGEYIFWETVDGIPCGYSPRLSQIGAEATPLEGYDIASAPTVLTSTASKRGGVPNAKDVYLIQPYYGLDESFTTQYVEEAERIAQATGGTATTYRTTAATIDAVAEAMESGAVVIFDSHGDTDYAQGEDSVSQANSSYLCLQVGTGLTSKDYEVATGAFGTYYHAFYGGSYKELKYYCVDGTAIANHMDKNGPNSLLWMAICLSMATDGLQAPLHAKGIEVVYGYSQSVTFTYDYRWEEAFWGKMTKGETVSQAIAYMKDEVGNWDWCHAAAYDTITEARETYSAFPIVVSSEDVYPGHGNVDDLQTVRSTWTLIAPCTHKSLIRHEAKAPNCLEEGNIAYYECKDCGAFFADEGLQNRITVTDTILPPEGHKYDNGTVTVPATCVTAGRKTYTCIACGYSYDTTIASTGHNYVQEICTLCGKQKPVVEPFSPGQSGTFVIAAKVNDVYLAFPNTYTNLSGKHIPNTVDASQGYVEKSLSANVALELTYDEATGKYTIYNGSYYLRYPSATNLGGIETPYYWTLEPGKNGTWRFTSETDYRGLVYRASSFNYFGGYYLPNVTAGSREYFDLEIIPIGEPLPVEPEKPTEPILDETIQIGHSLNLASDISINYAVKAEQLTNYDEYYLSCELPVYSGNGTMELSTVTVTPILKGDIYYFTLTGITSIQMNDTVTATLYMTKGDQVYRSNTDAYSVATYAYAQLRKPQTSQGLKKLCAELLRYGSYAQMYKGYRVDALADQDLTEAERAYLSSMEQVKFGKNNYLMDDLAVPAITWTGKTLNLESKITIKFVADLSAYTADPMDLSLRVSYKDYQGKTVTHVLGAPTLYHEEKKLYSFDFDGLLAAELRSVVSAAVYCGDTQVSPTTMYSADTYGNNKTGTLLLLCQAMISYSDTALSYFQGA